MPNDKLITWYLEQREKGISQEELVRALYELGYSKNELNNLLSAVEQFSLSQKPTQSQRLKPLTEPKRETGAGILVKTEPVHSKSVGRPSQEITFLEPPPGSEEETEAKNYKPTPARHVESKSLSEFLSGESHFFWNAILLLIVFVLVVVSLLLYILSSVPENGSDENITDLPKLDKISPTVSVTLAQSDWLSADDIHLKCVDSGVDITSGCDNSSYAFLISDVNSCPIEYSQYHPGLPNVLQNGFLCIAVKDIEGNHGFSVPVLIKLESIPQSSITDTSV